MIRTVDTPSIGMGQLAIVLASPEWEVDIKDFLQEGKLPSDVEKMRKVRNRAAWFTILEVVIYNRGFSEPLLRCLSSNEVPYVLAEVHEGVYGNYMGGRALAAKVTQVSYYWPHSLRGAQDFTKKFPKRQEHELVPHCPQRN